MITNINQLKQEEIRGKKVLVRVDFNVPVKDGVVVDDYRITRALPTIEFLRRSGAKVLLISHIETKGVDVPTLKPVHTLLSQTIPVSFIEDCFSDEARQGIDMLEESEVILFENIRRYEGEKKNDEEFGKKLAGLADVYVNDAFAVSHRSHASIVGVPKYIPSYAGLLLADEINNLKIDDQTPHPFLFILGGAKFDTKLPLIEKFLEKADKIFIGGALANDLLRLKGMDVKKSLVSTMSGSADETENPLEKLLTNPKIIIPEDLVWSEDKIVDAGPKVLVDLKPHIMSAKYILWNGPLGNYENGFKEGTITLSKLIGESSAQSVVGGGDTLASIKELGLMDQFTFISTGGGAMLDFLQAGTLVGIEALDK
jgi:3-phosphoglycerate kinase